MTSSTFCLPPLLEACQSLVKSNGSIVGSEIAARTRDQFPTLSSTIPPTRTSSSSSPPCCGTAFLTSLDGRLPLTHGQAKQFIDEFGPVLHTLGVGRGQRVALVLPNGPELALAILATAQWTGCVPLSATGAVAELEADLLRCGPDLIIGPYCTGPLPEIQPQEEAAMVTGGSDDNMSLSRLAELTHIMKGSTGRDWTVHHHVKDVATKLNIPFVGLIPDPDRAGPFKVCLSIGRKMKTALNYRDLPTVPESEPPEHPVDIQPNHGSDEALVLFTSGTTGNKKLVPHQIRDLLTGATVIALSWQLQPTDINCNMMPLFHVGGITRQVFAPLISGSCVICCPNFDPSFFWDLLESKALANNHGWYYAAPTMHQQILFHGQSYIEDARKRGERYTLKMIANAAGGLLPSLAVQLRETFGAYVLPSYGMTECMPISSPPADYKLTKPGTSGVPVGPEVAILNTHSVEPLKPYIEGPVCVRGEPCFRGYGVLANDPTAAKPATFLKDGWFDTGDLGYMDEDGYLYITGRSKEVINRGGEIIAPMEVEEAVMSHPDVKACAAFSADHDVLQETVGIVIVLNDPSKRRSLDLPSLHEHVADKLAAPKWPQCLVYMNDGLPKSHTNKLLRVKLGSRMGLPELSDTMSTWERTFEAECPPQGAALTDPIPSQAVTVDTNEVETVLRSVLKSKDVWVVPNGNRKGAVVAYVGAKMDRYQVLETALGCLDRYAVPTHICTVDGKARTVSHKKLTALPLKPQDAVATLLKGPSRGGDPSQQGTNDETTEKVIALFAEILNLDYIPTSDAHFFHIGGSSMVASQLAGKLRKEFNVPFNGAEIFHHPTPSDLAGAIQHRQNGESGKGGNKEGGSPNDPKVMEADRNDHGAPFVQQHLPPQSGFFSSLFQLVPMFILFPAWQIMRYLLFFTLLTEESRYMFTNDRDMKSFIMAYFIYYLLWITFCPLVFVGIKWIVIGRYQAGRYPIYGSYYLRWWFVDICRKLFLRGIWGWSDGMTRAYYRMLGAHVAANARISSDADIAEYDLVYISQNAAVENCTVRGFGVDNGGMILGPVKVGKNASVGIRSVVAPFTQVKPGTHLGPATSTYDETIGKSISAEHAHVNRMCYALPSTKLQLLVGGPIFLLTGLVSQIPPLIIMYQLLLYKSREDGNHFFGNWNELINWLCDPNRLPFFIGIRLARALISPFFYMFAAIVMKRLVIGKFTPGRRNTANDWENFRYWLASQLFTRKSIQKCTDLIGRHYELVSVLYRLLGCKVGKRVFWPGSLPTTDGVFDLLEIGDDCVFGSRSALFCTTDEHAARVVMCAGSNVSDNCVVMAGSVLGKGAVLGSNSVCPEGFYLPSGSVWFGANGCTPTCLNAGDGSDFEHYQPLNEGSGRGVTHASSTLDPKVMVMEGDESTIRPFGKAFYNNHPTRYRVWKLPTIIFFTLVSRIFQVIFHLLPLMGAVQLGAVLLYTDHVVKDIWRNQLWGKYNEYTYTDEEGVTHDKFLWWQRDFDNDGHNHNFYEVYFAILTAFIAMHFIRVILWLIIELSAKWLIMGRRKPGRYNYDTKSYCQRWELYQITAKIRKMSRLNLLQFLAGTPYMSTYFRWNGAKIGKDCCLFPTGASPFPPEPDLVTIGDHCVIDSAAICCHLNTRGNFELQRITIEDNCTLRTRSRVQQGVHMEAGSQLLEKSLAMTGELLDSRSVWQGSPASKWFTYKDDDLADYKPPMSMSKGKRSSKSKSSREIEMGAFTL